MKTSARFRDMAYAVLLAVLTTVSTAAAGASSVYVYGGPGSLEGTFQDAGGGMDEQGWLGVLCAEGEQAFYWQTSDFNAENLNSHGPGNHAMWAGQTAEQQPQWVNPPGYGNAYESGVYWTATAPTTAVPFTVDLEFSYNSDMEVIYDLVYVQWNRAGTWTTLDAIDGHSWSTFGVFDPPGVLYQRSWSVDPADLVGVGSDELQLRLFADSDGASSDEDGLYTGGQTDGAMQVDDIVVKFDGTPVDGGGDADGIATFESGDDEGWTPEPMVCSCTIISELDPDEDPSVDNLTPQLALIQRPGALGRGSCTFESPLISWQTEGNEQLDGTKLRFDTYSAGSGFWRLRMHYFQGGYFFFVDGIDWTPFVGGLWQSHEFDLTIPTDAEMVKIFWEPWSQASDVTASIDNISLERYDTTATATPAAASRARIESVRPNPTNPTTTVTFSLPQAGHVDLELFDVRGRRVRTLSQGPRTAGQHTVYFDGLDDGSRPVASGVYLVRLSGPGTVETRRLTVVR